MRRHPAPSVEFGRTRSVGCVLALLLCCSVLSACRTSLGGSEASSTEFLVGYAFSSPSGQVSRVIVPGVDMRFHGAWPGVALGVSDLTEIGPTGTADESPAGLSFRLPLAVVWSGSGGSHAIGVMLSERPVREATEAFIHHRTLGFGADPSGVGGPYSDVGILRVDPESDAVRRLDYDSSDRGGSSLTIERTGDR